jgi:hypothetical protein
MAVCTALVNKRIHLPAGPSAIVKVRTPARHGWCHVHGGRRPKTFKGGNRGLERFCGAANVPRRPDAMGI